MFTALHKVEQIQHVYVWGWGVGGSHLVIPALSQAIFNWALAFVREGVSDRGIVGALLSIDSR